MARERDLCDVKIKITEYFDGAELTEQTGLQPPGEVPTTFDPSSNGGQFFGQNNAGMAWPGTAGITMRQAPSANARPSRFYTLQRVNGNGGNGKGDGVAGPHKHTLEESDRVKKNSVQRWLMKNEREKKKAQVRFSLLPITSVSFASPCDVSKLAKMQHAWLSLVACTCFIAALRYCMAPAVATTNQYHHVMSMWDHSMCSLYVRGCNMVLGLVNICESYHVFHFSYDIYMDRALSESLLHAPLLHIQIFSSNFHFFIFTFTNLPSFCPFQDD